MNSATDSETDLERLFKAGIAAYQQGEYEQAVRALSQLKTCQRSEYRLKASMGLVRAYMAQQNWPQAQVLCQKIGTSSKPDLQQWSRKTLDKIAQRMSAAKSESAVNNSPQPICGDHEPVTVNGGFQPINPERDLAVEKAASGFQLLTAPDDVSTPHYQGSPVNQSSVVASPPPFQTSASSITSPVKNVNAKAPTLEPTSLPSIPSEDSSNSVSDGVSMFHYAYLNGEEIDADAAPNLVLPSDLEPVDSIPRGSTEGFVWPYANRLDKGRALGKIKRGQLWFMQVGGAIAFYVLLCTLIHGSVAVFNGYLSFLDRILPLRVGLLPYSLQYVTWPLLILMGVIMMTSPWLWDRWLRLIAGRRTFSVNALRSHSTEAATLIHRYCRQRRWPFPTLHKLPTDIPLIFSYGILPRNARLVISQGLLDQLQGDELATLVGYEMSHWKSWHWPLLSTQTLIAQAMLQAHWQLALWGNRQKTMIKWAVGAIATLLYGVFWLARLPGLGMARVRTYYGDRHAAELTGNPNGLARALSKLSFGLASSVVAQGYTPILIEGLMPVLPVAVDLSGQQMYGRLPLGQLFAWDSQNPLSVWMSTADSHPPLGNRLRLIMAYAQHWKLAPEIQLAAPSRKKKGMSGQHWRQLWTHATPYFGLALGLGFGLSLLGVGAIAAALNSPPPESTALATGVSVPPAPPSLILSALDWMHQDMGLLQCCVLLGASVGTMLRINRFFPDLTFSAPLDHDTAAWVSDADLLPAHSPQAKLAGTLVGRPGIANWLGQDLFLKTQLGLLQLHYVSWCGPLGNVLSLSQTPTHLLGQSVQVVGWFRRGNRPWIDVDKIRLGNGTFLRAAHPIYSLLVAVFALLFGLWLLMRNSSYM